MQSTILDFHISLAAADRYSVEVFARGASQPLAASAFDYRLSSLTEYGIDQLDFDPKDPKGRIERLRNFGNDLHRKLFSPDIQHVWQAQKGSSDVLILCLRIAPEARGLEALPWETLHDGEAFLAVSEKTGLSRLPLDIEPQADLPPIPLPLKMLSFTSLPLELREHGRLQIEREQELLLQSINDPAGQGKVQIDFEDEAKLRILESSMELGYHLFHFSGHGIPPKEGGGLLLEDDDDKPCPTSVDEILKSLEKGFSTLRLAVISGCQTARTSPVTNFSDLARGLAAHRIPAVIAMQFKISDDGGLKLAETLYPKLLNGGPIEIALSDTRRQMWESGDPHIQADALAMVLFTSNGQCLKTIAAEAMPPSVDQQLDKSFHMGTLPQLGFGFYGRRREYRQLRDDLFVRNHRAVIIHGLGGIGKTSLVSHAAERLKKRFKGVYAFDCSSGALAPERIIYELHEYFREQGLNDLQSIVHQSLSPEELAQTLATLLHKWPLLLIFDNFETQLERTDERFRIVDTHLRTFLATLITADLPASRFLFTSRYLFDLDDEHLGSVQSLPLHDLNRSEAIMLMYRLPSLAPTYYVEKQHIYRIFGGHPYALMLTDRHCHSHSVGRALRDASDLKSKLREFLAIEMTYSVLSHACQRILNRFAAFRRGEDLEAVKRVTGEENNLKRLIQELIEWGLFIPVQASGHSLIFSVHNLVRDFCRNRQDPKDWREHLRLAAGFYIGSLDLSDRAHKSADEVWGEMEAFELLMEAEDFADAAKVLVRADRFLDRWGMGRYVESQYHRLLGKVEGRDEAMVRHNLGNFMKAHGNYDEALNLYQHSLKIAEEIGEQEVVSRSLHQIGMLHHARSDYDLALENYQKSLKMGEDLGDKALISSSLHQIGMFHQARGQYDLALNYYQQSFEITEEIGDLSGAATSLHQIGTVHENCSRYDASLDFYQRSLKIKEDINNVGGIASSLHQIGLLMQLRGKYDIALEYYLRSLKINEEIGRVDHLATSLHQVGNIHYLRGSYDTALDHYQRSLKMREELGDKSSVASSLYQIGVIHYVRGSYDQALECYHQALKIGEKIGDKDIIASSFHQIGMLNQSRGNYVVSLEYYQQSLKIKEDLGDVNGIGCSLHQIGLLHKSRGDYDLALDNYGRSLKIAEELGDVAGKGRSFSEIGRIHQARGKYDSALDYYQRSLDISEELGDLSGIAASLHQIGVLHQTRGDYEAALDHYHRSLKYNEELSKVAAIASSLNQIGNIHFLRDDYDTALEYYEGSLKIKEEIGEIAGIATSLHQIGVLHFYNGNCNAAFDYHKRALQIKEKLGDRAGISRSFHEIGKLHQSRGDYDAALDYFQRSLKIKEDLGDVAGVARTRGQIGMMLTETGQYQQSISYLSTALSTFLEIKSSDVGIAIDLLKELRGKWGEREFDAAWEKETNTILPEWL